MLKQSRIRFFLFFTFCDCILCFSFVCHKPYQKLSSPVIKGAAVAHVHQPGKGYGSGVSRKLYRRLKKYGYNAIQLNTFAYQRSMAQIRLFWDDPTLTEKHLADEIKLVQAEGLKVMLKPHIWLTENWKPSVWRSQIDYDSKDKVKKWFQEYSIFIKNQVEIAIQNEVEFFVVGTELVKLTQYEEHWRELIQNIRKWGYEGKLTYSCEAWNAKNIDFWDGLDFIGLNFYYSYKKKPVKTQEVIEFYSAKLLEHIRHAQKFDLPIMLTEVGFPSHQYAIEKPALWRSDSLNKDNLMQRKAYEILRKSMEKISYPYGIWIWKYVTTLNSYESKSHATGFILENKPAEKEILKMFKSKR